MGIKKRDKHSKSHQSYGKAVSPTKVKKGSTPDAVANKDFDTQLASLKARLSGPKRKKVQQNISLSQPIFRSPSSLKAEEEERANSERKRLEKLAMDSLFEQSDKGANGFVQGRDGSSSSVGGTVNRAKGHTGGRFAVLDDDEGDSPSASGAPQLAQPIFSSGGWVGDGGVDVNDL